MINAHTIGQYAASYNEELQLQVVLTKVDNLPLINSETTAAHQQPEKTGSLLCLFRWFDNVAICRLS